MTASLRFLIAALVVGLLGCDAEVKPPVKSVSQVTPAPAVDSQDQAASSSAKEEADSPIRVTDDLGREIVLKQTAKRIVSLSPRTTESLFAIGAGEQVVGVTTYCNFPPEASSRAKVGGFSAKSLSVESIVSLQPDLVVSAGEIQRPITDQLERLGLTVLGLHSESLSDLKSELSRLGRATGHDKTAMELTESITQRIARIEEQAAKVPQEQRRTVFYLAWDEPLTGAGPDSYLGEMIQICGGVNVVTDATARYPKLNPEVLIAADPDLILTSTNHKGIFTAEGLQSRPGWSSLTAIRNGQIHFLEGDLVSRCSPRVVEALDQMAAIIQPKLSSTEEPSASPPDAEGTP